MTYKVAAFYQFVTLPDYRSLKDPVERFCADLQLKGTFLLAQEGVNGTLAGTPEAIAAFVASCRNGGLLGRALDHLELKFSNAAELPFRRLKIRLKKEIVTLGDPQTDPTQQVGTYVEPADWNLLLDTPDLLVIDTRNRFEVEMGTFEGALDPGLDRFGDFPAFTARALDPRVHRKVAMFCTGGIRCEKASAFMLRHGFEEVYHLKGGILRYLETVPAAESRWTGECFVFDERVALGHGLVERSRAKKGQDND